MSIFAFTTVINIAILSVAFTILIAALVIMMAAACLDLTMWLLPDPQEFDCKSDPNEQTDP